MGHRLGGDRLDGRTHIAWSIALGIMISGLYMSSPTLACAITLVTVIGGVLPDIDHPKSFLGHWFVAVNYGVKHRGFMHSVWAMLLLFLVGLKLSFVASTQLIVAFFCGYTLHFVLDAITPAGISLFYPLPFGKLKGIVPSQGIMAFAVLLCGVALAGLAAWFYIQHVLF